MLQRPDEETGADEKRQRHGDLEHDQRASHVVLFRCAADARVLQRLSGIDLHGADRGKDAEEHAGQERDSQRERQESRVDASGRRRQGELPHQSHRPVRHDHPGDAAQQRPAPRSR